MDGSRGSEKQHTMYILIFGRRRPSCKSILTNAELELFPGMYVETCLVWLSRIKYISSKRKPFAGCIWLVQVKYWNQLHALHETSSMKICHLLSTDNFSLMRCKKWQCNYIYVGALLADSNCISFPGEVVGVGAPGWSSWSSLGKPGVPNPRKNMVHKYKNLKFLFCSRSH